jgi:DNA-binding winged helix-turn-helix (wHTH) protein
MKPERSLSSCDFQPYIYRFGVFAFDPDRSELRRDDRVVRLQPQPAQVLAVLLERAGVLVTRDELRAAIWGHDTFVDFDRGLNFCVAQIRAALADNATTPRYVRTVPKSGYEFICPVEPPTSSVPWERRPCACGLRSRPTAWCSP